MNDILLFKKDLENYPTTSLNSLRRYFGLPSANRNDLVWLISIYQAQQNPNGMKKARMYSGPPMIISAGHGFSLGILEDGNVWDSGDIYWRNKTIPYTNGRRFIQVSAGSTHRLGLLEDGTVRGWGINN